MDDVVTRVNVRTASGVRAAGKTTKRIQHGTSCIWKGATYRVVEVFWHAANKATALLHPAE